MELYCHLVSPILKTAVTSKPLLCPDQIMYITLTFFQLKFRPSVNGIEYHHSHVRMCVYVCVYTCLCVCMYFALGVCRGWLADAGAGLQGPVRGRVGGVVREPPLR